MVNVPGGSKGCAECRRRKVKCDEEQPICGRCRKTGLKCGGYRQTFKIYTCETAQNKNALIQWEPEASTRVKSAGSQADWQLLGPSHHKVEIQIHYLAALIYRAVPINDDIHNEQPWMHVSIAYDETQAVYYAAAALGGLQVAHIFDCGSHDLTRTSPLYVKAIQLLSQNLMHKERCYSEGNVAATLLLYLYELAVGDKAQSWVHHHEGLARLVEFYGPERFKPWLARKHFMMCRSTIIFYGIETRQRSFLEHPNWKHIPWSTSRLPKLPMQTLMDIVADIPGLLQDSDQLKGQEGLTDQQNLCDRILSTIMLLFIWRFQFEKDYPNFSYTVAIEPSTILTHINVPEKYATGSLWFTQFERAQEVATYNAALLVAMQLMETWEILHRMSEVLSNHAMLERPLATFQPLLLPSPTIHPGQVLEEIYRSAAYFLHPSHSRSGLLAMFYPLLCWSVYQDYAPKVLPLKMRLSDKIAASFITSSPQIELSLAHRYGGD